MILHGIFRDTEVAEFLKMIYISKKQKKKRSRVQINNISIMNVHYKTMPKLNSLIVHLVQLENTINLLG